MRIREAQKHVDPQHRSWLKKKSASRRRHPKKSRSVLGEAQASSAEMKERKGASPVPGPTRIQGTEGSGGNLRVPLLYAISNIVK
jgi:hypothetical protein